MPGRHVELIGQAAAQTAGTIDVWVREPIGEPRLQRR
jgi:hypothetical protein